MAKGQYFLIEGRVIYSEFGDVLTIISPPYRENRYLFSFCLFMLIYVSTIFFFIYYEEVVSAISNIKNDILSIILGGLLCMAIFGSFFAFLWIIKIFRYAFYNNLFLKEELTVSKNEIVLKKNGEIVSRFNLLIIREIHFSSKKDSPSHMDMGPYAPNYAPTITIYLDDSRKKKLFFKSIKENEVIFIFNAIVEHLLNNEIKITYTSQRTLQYIIFQPRSAKLAV